MNTDTPIIKVFYEGKCWDLGLQGTNSRCTFGGPLLQEVSSTVSLKKAAIHHLGEINLPTFNAGYKYGMTLPLLYGICHEGCEMEYNKVASHAVNITSIIPTKADIGYPYHNYPALLPYYQLGIVKESEASVEDIKDTFHNTGWSFNPAHLYALVMQHPHIGHCLFDLDDVEVAFDFDTESGEVKVVNQCG